MHGDGGGVVVVMMVMIVILVVMAWSCDVGGDGGGVASHRYRGSGHRKHHAIDTNNISSLLDNLLQGYDQQLRPSHGG